MKFITLTGYRDCAKVMVNVNRIAAIHPRESITSGTILWLDGSELIVTETPEEIEKMIIETTRPRPVAKKSEFCGTCFTDQLSGI